MKFAQQKNRRVNDTEKNTERDGTMYSTLPFHATNSNQLTDAGK